MNVHVPRWLEAASETERDIREAPDRALAVDQAAQRRSIQPDVVRRQIKCLEYVQRHGGTDGVRAGMSAVELLITLERLNATQAGIIRRQVLAGEIKIHDLRAEITSAKTAESAFLQQPDRAEVLARLQQDLPDFARFRVLDAGDDVIGADFTAVVNEQPTMRRWAWAGVMAPSLSGCHRGAPLRQFVRSVIAASVLADTVSAMVTLARESEAVAAVMAQARPEDLSRICIHHWRSRGGVWLTA